jgi:hypothetical protein
MSINALGLLPVTVTIAENTIIYSHLPNFTVAIFTLKRLHTSMYFTPLYSHCSDFTPNYLRNSHKLVQKLLKLHTLLPFIDLKHTCMIPKIHLCIECQHVYIIPRSAHIIPHFTDIIPHSTDIIPLLSYIKHQNNVITSISLSAEFRGYLFTSL